MLSLNNSKLGLSFYCTSLMFYCTLALTAALLFKVNVQLAFLDPLLEHAPDQTADRPLDTVSVIALPVFIEADPELPTATLMPAGLEVTRSPLRPLADKVSVAVCAGGGGGG